ncbi:MAG: molybdopterin molybdenumtransferase MoeA, partial [Gammaproteobacteria bacterium]
MNSCDTTPLLSYDEALERLTESIAPVAGIVERELSALLGSVLAEAVVSAIDVPGCAMSAMDGYAINTADLAQHGPTRLPVSQRIPAGG